MRLSRPLLVAWCSGLIVGGCTSELKLDLAGKRCNRDDKCSPGYSCELETKVCLPTDEPLPSAGSGGSSGNPSEGGGGGSGSVHWGGDSGIGPGGFGGALWPSDDGGVAGGGAGGAGGLDAGVDGPPDASDGCAPITVYRDADGDSFGAGPAFQGCPQPGWVTNADDCGDGDGLAHPGQEGFFGDGFDDSRNPGVKSYDYDCSGVEEVDPTNSPPNEVQRCDDITDLLICSGEGYLADEARGGAGINPLCGSKIRRNCVARVGTGCTGIDTNLTPADAFRCR